MKKGVLRERERRERRRYEKEGDEETKKRMKGRIDW